MGEDNLFKSAGYRWIILASKCLLHAQRIGKMHAPILLKSNYCVRSSWLDLKNCFSHFTFLSILSREYKIWQFFLYLYIMCISSHFKLNTMHTKTSVLPYLRHRTLAYSKSVVSKPSYPMSLEPLPMHSCTYLNIPSTLTSRFLFLETLSHPSSPPFYEKFHRHPSHTAPPCSIKPPT